MSKDFITIDDLIVDFKNGKITTRQFKIWHDLTLRDPAVNKEYVSQKTNELLTQIAESIDKSTIHRSYLPAYQELLDAFKFRLESQKPIVISSPQENKTSISIPMEIETRQDVSERESLLRKSENVVSYGATTNSPSTPQKSVCARICEQISAIFIRQRH